VIDCPPELRKLAQPFVGPSLAEVPKLLRLA